MPVRALDPGFSDELKMLKALQIVLTVGESRGLISRLYNTSQRENYVKRSLSLENWNKQLGAIGLGRLGGMLCIDWPPQCQL